MYKNDREITDKTEIEAIISRARVCRLGMSDNGQPYVVPLCFGYRDNTLYFHTAQTGKKLDIIKNNPRVCVEFDMSGEIVRGEKACKWGMGFESVIGFGEAFLVEDNDSKREALDIIMAQYGGEGEFTYLEKALDVTMVIKVLIRDITGKKAS